MRKEGKCIPKHRDLTKTGRDPNTGEKKGHIHTTTSLSREAIHSRRDIAKLSELILK